MIVVDRLGDVTVRVIGVRFVDVFFRLGSGQNDDRDFAQHGMFLYLGQDFAPILLRKIQIQED